MADERFERRTATRFVPALAVATCLVVARMGLQGRLAHGNALLLAPPVLSLSIPLAFFWTLLRSLEPSAGPSNRRNCFLVMAAVAFVTYFASTVTPWTNAAWMDSRVGSLVGEVHGARLESSPVKEPHAAARVTVCWMSPPAPWELLLRGAGLGLAPITAAVLALAMTRLSGSAWSASMATCATVLAGSLFATIATRAAGARLIGADWARVPLQVLAPNAVLIVLAAMLAAGARIASASRCRREVVA